jgi:hypothetical protein
MVGARNHGINDIEKTDRRHHSEKLLQFYRRMTA